MKTLRRLIYGEILIAVLFVLLAFLALFSFFDLVDELPTLAVGVESPALIMVGSVVTLADQLAWFGEAPQLQQALA